ncbi:MAG: DegT/DnrJ/EryC1/StrS family aminotransferase [Armatimonadetes bacterium]|nr:DegT/DnrJ/EryC1/StrS family aminotransferase [Akkermansiaceae bacterium]
MHSKKPSESFLNSFKHRIPVAAPVLADKTMAMVSECIEGTWISSAGKYITAFEQRFAEFTGSKHAIACTNGTAALHLALMGMDLREGDEVIVPALTYIATANAVRYCGATPVFADCDPLTLTLCPDSVEKNLTPRTKGIIPVHLYGHPVDMDRLNQMALTHGLWVVEDAAEAHGAKYRNRKVGSLADCATFSFYGNKIISTGEGGMITCDNDLLAAKLRLYRGQGMDPYRRYWHPVVGFNYRMTNIVAAIGLAQMERVETALAARQKVAHTYNRLLASASDQLQLPHVAEWAHHVFWMYTVILKGISEDRRDAIIQYMDHRGIETRPFFYPVNSMPPYLGQKGEVPVSASLAASGICLPTHERLTDEDQTWIGEVLIQAIEHSR